MNAVDLAALLADPSRIRELPARQIPPVLARLAALQSALTTRLLEQADEPSAELVNSSDDRGDWIKIGEASALIHKSPKWFYRHAGDLPFIKRISAKSMLVSRSGMDRWIQRQKA